MKNIQKVMYLVFAFALFAFIALPSGRTHAATTGFRVVGRNLVDANGNNFIMRGINHAHAWYPQQTGSFANIKATGANTIRVVIQGGARWGKNSPTDVANVISLCKTNKLVCILENHDTTGYGEDATSVSLAASVQYWLELQSVLTGQEAYVIINIGNEPYGNVNASNWVNDTKNAITSLRAAGFKHTLMVDAPNWGQDWSGTMKNNAAGIFNHDPEKNIVFSVHMYGVYNTASIVRDYMAAYVNANLPLVIGEFGDNHSDGDPDENTIMSEAQAKGIGYLGWSWSGNGGGVEYLDLVTGFNPSQRSAWGNRLITGANGISTTSVEASIFQSTPTPQPAKPVPGTIQAEDFDAGSEGVAYHDTDSVNSKGQYRTTGVDIEVSTDSGGHNIADIQNTEWLRYTIHAANSGSYTLQARVASASSGGSMYVEVDGVNVTGTMNIPATGGWQTWTTISKSGINLSAGQHTVRLVFTSAGFNVNWFSLGAASATNTPAGPTATPTSIPPTSVPGNLKVQLMGSGTDNNQQSSFKLAVKNTGASARSNISVRVYFTTENGNPGSAYTLEKYWDQSGVAAISGPTLASGSTYYFTVSFGTASLAPGATWEFHTALHLGNWASSYASANDWWRATGSLPSAFTDWTRVPAYISGTRVWGAQP